ncbi:MAG: sulfatase-like hydrolase/transferase, partial [Lentisphaeraceae bacterium]|nr:sulfatase-like hydrolase/transferase [Lentisphaeraceae bacterium]
MKTFPFLITLFFLWSCSTAGINKPNVIVILADDAGYGDFGFMGSEEFKTPHIDQLAAAGVLFSDAYVTACMCAPSRAGLISGRYQQKLGFHLNLPHNYNHSYGLDTEVKTVAERMHELGYATAAFGKWHLGHEAKYHPNARGFDYFYGFAAGHRNYFPLEKEELEEVAYKLERNGVEIKEGKGFYMTDALSDDAVDYIRKKHHKPFFMYLAYSAVHTPMHAKEEDLKLFAHIKDPNRRILAAMTKAMDDGVGRIRATLKELKLDKNTIVWFLNDNGGAYSNFSSNGVLRGGKGGLSEGGLRVPSAIVWPDKITAGQKHSQAISSLDIAPTIVKAAGGDFDKEALDGIDIIPQILAGTKTSRVLFWGS